MRSTNSELHRNFQAGLGSSVTVSGTAQAVKQIGQLQVSTSLLLLQVQCPMSLQLWDRPLSEDPSLSHLQQTAQIPSKLLPLLPSCPSTHSSRLFLGICHPSLPEKQAGQQSRQAIFRSSLPPLLQTQSPVSFPTLQQTPCCGSSLIPRGLSKSWRKTLFSSLVDPLGHPSSSSSPFLSVSSPYLQTCSTWNPQWPHLEGCERIPYQAANSHILS